MSSLRPSSWSLDLNSHRNIAGVQAGIVLMSGGSFVMLDPSKSRQSFNFGRAAPSVKFDVRQPWISLPKLKLPDVLIAEPEAAPNDRTSAEVAATEPRLGNREERSLRGSEQANTKVADDDVAGSKHFLQALERVSKAQDTSRRRNHTVFMTHAFHGAELSRSDFQGAAIYVPAQADGGLFVGPGRAAMLLGINAAELRLGLSSPRTFDLADSAIARARALVLLDGVNVAVPRDGPGFLVGHMN